MRLFWELHEITICTVLKEKKKALLRLLASESPGVHILWTLDLVLGLLVESSWILGLEVCILVRTLVIFKHTELWKLLALGFKILLPLLHEFWFYVSVLIATLCLVSTHSLLRIRQGRITKHKCSFGKDYKNQDKEMTSAGCPVFSFLRCN